MNTKKMYVVITDQERFAAGDMGYALSLFDHPTTVKGWINVCEVEIDLSSVSMADITTAAVAEIDHQIDTARANFEVAIQTLEGKRNNLLALTHDGDS